MNTITLKSDMMVNNKKKNTLKSRIKNYFIENQAILTVGLYAASGRIPDPVMLRSLNMR